MDHQQVAEGLQGRDRLLPRPGSDRARAALERRLFQAIEAAFAVGRDDLCAATRGRCDIALARQTGMYLARVALGMTLSEAGRLFSRDRTTASHACRLVEDLRDDPVFDVVLATLEASLHRVPDGSARR